MVRRKLINATGNKSQRKFDYQELIERNTLEVSSLEISPGIGDDLVLESAIEFSAGDVVAIGFYAKSSRDFRTTIHFTINDTESVKEFEINTNWNRFYHYIKVNSSGKKVETQIPLNKNTLFLFGYNIKSLSLDIMKNRLDDKTLTASDLDEILVNAALMPEIAYIQHDKQLIDARIMNNKDLKVVVNSTTKLKLKYCSLCDRLLPARETTGDVLAFHKHKPQANGSFRSGYQQECRACKNRNINRKLNPKRTPDQFFESSLLHRERMMFLEEPEIFDAINSKYKNNFLGFKAFIWNKFNRKCFNCGKPLRLTEVQLDHTRPLSLFWALDEHATSLCSTCNNAKRGRPPAEFYSREKLKQLSKITGLDLKELQDSGFNKAMLSKIINDIERYAGQWSPNFFDNTRKRVLEYFPSIDILKVYERKTGKKYNKKVEKT